MAIQPGVWGIDLGQCALKALRLEVIDGQVTTEEAVARTAQRTRRYANAQRTWFRKDRRIRWVTRGEGPVDDARSLGNGERGRGHLKKLRPGALLE